MNIRPNTIELLEENIGNKLLDISLSNGFLGYDARSKGNKSKNKQVRLHQRLPRWLSVKRIYLPMQETQEMEQGSIPGSRISPEVAIHFTSLYLPGKSMDRGTWQATIHGVTKELDVT